MSDSIFGDNIIHSYTRAQALEDGIQFNRSDDIGTDVYKYPVFVTASLEAALVKGDGKDPDTYSARLWDVCYLVSHGRGKGSTREAIVKIGARNFTVRGECGAFDLDDPRPTITLGFPEDF